MDYKILNEKKILDEFFQVYKAKVEHDSYSGEPITATRDALDRGDSAAILIYEKDTDSFLFTEQFRYPSSRRDVPFILELVAGAVDDGEEPRTSVIREVKEEIGYDLSDVQLIHKYFPSPGMNSEVVYLYFAEVCLTDKKHQGGGSKSEKEDIKLVKLSRKRARQRLLDSQFNNSITIIGLQWYFLNK